MTSGSMQVWHASDTAERRQRNFSKQDTFGTRKSVLIRGASLFSGVKMYRNMVFGDSGSVLFFKMSTV